MNRAGCCVWRVRERGRRYRPQCARRGTIVWRGRLLCPVHRRRVEEKLRRVA